MTPPGADKEFVNYVVEMMQALGPVYAKSMFGGHGIFLDGLMFALMSDGVLYLKADHLTKQKFINNNLDPFTYYKKGKEFKMSYYQCPEEALESSEEMNHWAGKAYQTALNMAAKKHR